MKLSWRARATATLALRPSVRFGYLNGVGGSGGYNHWGGMILPSCRRHPLSVCNSDNNGDLAPTNTLDLQAPQISYLANETIMGRPRTHFQVVSQATSKRQ